MIVASCDTYDFIDITNQCDAEVVFTQGLDTIPDFPSINQTDYYLSQSINKGEATRLSKTGNNAWRRYIDESERKRISIFVYETDSLKKYGNIDSLKLRKLYKRLEYGSGDLEKMNYQISICY